MGWGGMKDRRQNEMREGQQREKTVKIIWYKILSEAHDLFISLVSCG